MKIQAKARIQIVVEVEACQPWSDDCTIDQVYKQAVVDGTKVLQNALKDGEHGRIHVIGEPKVIAVITEQS